MTDSRKFCALEDEINRYKDRPILDIPHKLIVELEKVMSNVIKEEISTLIKRFGREVKAEDKDSYDKDVEEANNTLAQATTINDLLWEQSFWVDKLSSHSHIVNFYDRLWEMNKLLKDYNYLKSIMSVE